MSQEFHREYLVRLPLPLAQLYSRAHNAKDGRGRHDNCFYLFEALIKLAGCPLIAAYLDEVRMGRRVESLDKLLVQLALPSLGQWTAILRELARHFGERPDAASHPMGHVWDQLNKKRRDLPGVLELYQQIKNGPDGQAANDKSCSILALFDSLVQYRNTVFGHGAGRITSFYENEMGPLLFPAVNEVLADRVFELLGPHGTQFVYINAVRVVDEQRVELELRELVGLQGERMAPFALDSQHAANQAPHRVAVIWPGRSAPVSLDPLLVHRETEVAEEVLFLNRDRNGRQVEYLSYTTGRTERDKSMAPSMARFMSRVTGTEIDPSQLDELEEASLEETPWHPFRVEQALESEESDQGTMTLGDYEILAELGRGGMGVVYLARQLSLGRLVALKMLPADLAGDELTLARFRREMRALGQCEHANIVKVLTSGEMPDGQLYYAMEYVPGADLEYIWRELAGPNYQGQASNLGGTTWSRAVLSASSKFRQKTFDKTKSGRGEKTAHGREQTESVAEDGNGPSKVSLLESTLPPLPELANVESDPGGYSRRVAGMMRDAALAVQAVHDQKIVHRDIKPANLMLTADGSRVVLMDFGLAKGQNMSLTASRSAGFLGTLRYSAPEQLASAKLEVGPPADVRALGITMWELLTRQRLFGEAEDERQLSSWVLTQDVPALRSVDSSLDADLEAIVARATERSDENRIQSAQELAGYLDLYLEGKPLPIRMPTSTEMIRRWVGDHKALVSSAVAAVVAVVLTVAIAFVLVWQAKDAAMGLAKQNEKLADEQEQKRLEADQARMEADHQRRAAIKSEKEANEARDEADKAKQDALNLLANNKNLTAKATAIALAAESHMVQKKFPQKSLVFALEAVEATQPISQFILATSERQPIPPFVQESLRSALSKMGGVGLGGQKDELISSVALSANGQWMVTGRINGKARLWDLRGEESANKSKHEWRAHRRSISAIAMSPNGRWLATGSDDRKVRLWEVETDGSIVQCREFDDHEGSISAIEFSHDGRWLVTGEDYKDNTVRVWDVLPSSIQRNSHTKLQKSVRTLKGHKDAVTSIAISHDGKWIVTGGKDMTAKVWDLSVVSSASSEGHSAAITSLAHDANVTAVSISSDNRVVITGCDDTTIRWWNLADDGSIDEGKTLEYALNQSPGDARIASLAISPDQRWMASSSNDQTARLWKLANDNAVDVGVKLRGHDGLIGDLAFRQTRSGEFQLVTGSHDGTARRWTLAAGDPTASPIVFRGHFFRVRDNGIAISPDRRWVASASYDSIAESYDPTACLWDLRVKNPASTPSNIPVDNYAITSVAFSHDNLTLATGCDDKKVRLWSLESGSLKLRNAGLIGPDDGISAIALSPDNRWLVAGGAKTARLWDLKNDSAGARSFIIENYSSNTAIQFSPNGNWLVTGSAGNPIRLWDLTTEDPGKSSFILEEPGTMITSAKFSPNSQWLQTISSADTTRRWDLRKLSKIERTKDLNLEELSEEFEEETIAVEFSRDNRWLATAMLDNNVHVWKLNDDGERQSRIVLQGHQHRIRTIAISPNSRWLATGSEDETGRVWDLNAEKLTKSVKVLRDHDATVRSVVFSPDSRWLVTTARDDHELKDESVHLWDLKTPGGTNEAVTLMDHDKPIDTLTFSADSQWLISVDDFGAVRQWDLDLDRLAESACGVAGRKLTDDERHQLGLDALKLD